MAPAPAAKPGEVPARAQSYGRFIDLVSAGTGLPMSVVTTWVIAEGGKLDNPLNIRRPDGHFGGFGSQEAAARAVIENLRSGAHGYDRILTAARGTDVRGMLQAIADSGWDAGHYRGGSLLFGVYKSLFGEPGKVKARDPDNPGEVTQETEAGAISVDGGVLGFVQGLPAWIESRAVLALAYVTLTGAAGVLFVLGLLAVAGSSPSAAVGAVAARRAAKEAIPF